MLSEVIIILSSKISIVDIFLLIHSPNALLEIGFFIILEVDTILFVCTHVVEP